MTGALSASCCPTARCRPGITPSGAAGGGRAGTLGPSVQADFTVKPAWDLERLKPNDFFPVPASVVFARKLPQDASGKPLAGPVERWVGIAGAEDVRRESAGITDTGAAGDSPYAALSRNGATIFPRVLFFVNETANTAIVRARLRLPSTPDGEARTRHPGRTWT